MFQLAIIFLSTLVFLTHPSNILNTFHMGKTCDWPMGAEFCTLYMVYEINV